MRALVIDDSRATRGILGEILKDIGFDVFQAGHGREGLQLLKQLEEVDVVLVDWIMPEMDGLEFLRAVRSEASLDKVRLMMVTTETAMPQVAKALEEGANEYVMKPVTKEMIKEKLELMGVVLPGTSSEAD